MKDGVIEGLKTIDTSILDRTAPHVPGYKRFILRGVLDSMKAIFRAVLEAGYQPSETENLVLVHHVLDYLPIMGQPYLPGGMVDAMCRVWRDPAVRKVIGEGLVESEFLDSAV
jgi:hypothetical protein